ncbi:SCO family protein [Polaribacter sp. MSW13]|uniref:SCO family protein n=1 Tax=Polaribacter marinus TaxID=2916838 RepID=A0A9X1VNK2_9FLAO|nr:SCO family protein [Polaribacter marinus]MCI2229355.1 SCO family protein [Polaribacter marinus]
MKKKYSYVGITFIILLFGIYVVRNLDRRSKENDLVQEDRLNKVDKDYVKNNALFTFDKVPEFEFTDQNGETISNKDYKGKVYVVEFFFSTCPTICPIMNKKMLTIQDDFSSESDFGIASFSITPDIDTPEILKEYAKKNRITHKNWHLLTGKSDEVVYALANKGFKLYAGKGDEEHGGFEHSGLFALVDKNGYIRSRKDDYGNPIMYYRALEEQGFSDQIKELKEDIKILLNE